MTNRIDLSAEYAKVSEGNLENEEMLIVVKSQNQIARRERMIDSKRKKRYGRFKPSPTNIGLLVNAMLKDGRVCVNWTREFREPRHIKKKANGNYLLTEVNRLNEINISGEVLKSYEHPFFGYLHSVDVKADGKHALLVSSGYDAIIEINLDTGNETWSWFAWDHGFNPSEDGTWYSISKNTHSDWLSQGKSSILIDPREYGEQGVTTANRVAHPNSAIYEYSCGETSILASLGHKGILARISMKDGSHEIMFDGLSNMAHGIFKNPGKRTCVTQTTRGEWLILNQNYEVESIYNFSTLAGKVAGSEDSEWNQQVVPLNENNAIAIDANRGIITLDILKKEYSIYDPDPNWCIQDALIV